MAILYPLKYDTSAATRTGGFIYNAYLGTCFTNTTGSEIKVTDIEIYCKNGVGTSYTGYYGWASNSTSISNFEFSNKKGITSNFAWQKFTLNEPLVVSKNSNFYAGILNQTGYQTTIYRYIGSTTGNAYYLASTNMTSGTIQANNTVMSTDNTLCTPYIRVIYESTTTKCGKPSSININSSKVKTNNKITITWGEGTNGINNTINGYEIVQQIGSGSFTSLGTVSSTTRTKTITISNIVGTIYKFKVRTLGTAGSNYYSDYTSTVSCKVINTAPTITTPVASNTKIITTGTNVKFSWSASDADGDALTYNYRIRDNTAGKDILSGNTTNTFITIGVGSIGNKTFYVSASDGSNSSNESSVKLIYNNKPGAPTISTTNGGYKITTTFSWTTSDNDNDTLTYDVQRMYEGETTWKTISTKQSSKSYTDTISSSYKGKKISYRVRAYDGIEYGEYSNVYYFYRNILPGAPISFTIQGEKGDTLKIAENIIKISWGEPSTGTSISGGKYAIEAQISSSKDDFSGKTWYSIATINNPTTTYTHNISNYYSRGNYIRYRILFTDALGEKSDYNTILESNAIQRNKLPVAKTLTSEDVSNNGLIKIWDKPSITLNWESMENNDDGEGQYGLAFIHSNGIFDIFKNEKIDNINSLTYSKINTKQVALLQSGNSEAEEFSTFIGTIFGYNAEANGLFSSGYFELYTKDAFGKLGSTSKLYVNFDTRFKPIIGDFEGNYIKVNTMADDYIINYSSENFYAMVNTGETLSFIIPTITDKNGEESFTYSLMAYEDATVNKISNTPGESEYKTLKKVTNLEEDNSIQYTVPNLAENKVVRFALKVIDSSGLSTFKKLDIGVEFCRVVNPKIRVDLLQVTNVDAENNTASLKYKIIIEDNGGSKINSSRKTSEGEQVTYVHRRNLERIENNRLFYIQIRHSKDPNDKVVLEKYKLSITNDVKQIYPASGTVYEGTISGYDSDENGPYYKNTRYAYALLRMDDAKTNLQTERIGWSDNLTIYKYGAPALAGRNYGVGINTYDPEARFQVAPQNQNELAIFGEIPNNNNENILNYPLIINLSTGELVAAIFDFGDLG